MHINLTAIKQCKMLLIKTKETKIIMLFFGSWRDTEFLCVCISRVQFSFFVCALAQSLSSSMILQYHPRFCEKPMQINE